MDVKNYLKTNLNNNAVDFAMLHENGGGALIAYGAFTLFKELALDINIQKDVLQPKNDVLLINGNGNFNPMYSDVKNILTSAIGKYRKIILLPCTIVGNEELLKSLSENVTIFAREQVTFDYLMSLNLTAEVYLDHDLAVHIRASEIPDVGVIKLFGAIVSSFFGGKSAGMPKLQMLKLLWFLITAKFVSRRLFLRSDVESSGLASQFAKTHDLSSIFDINIKNEYSNELCSHLLLNYVAKCHDIVTDRLHIGFAAGITNVKCEQHGNSYFKNKAMYQFTIGKLYNSVTWKD